MPDHSVQIYLNLCRCPLLPSPQEDLLRLSCCLEQLADLLPLLPGDCARSGGLGLGLKKMFFFVFAKYRILYIITKIISIYA